MPPKTKEDWERILKEERAVLRRRRGEFVHDLEVTLAAIQVSDKAGCDDDAFCQFVRCTAAHYANLGNSWKTPCALCTTWRWRRL